MKSWLLVGIFLKKDLTFQKEELMVLVMKKLYYQLTLSKK